MYPIIRCPSCNNSIGEIIELYNTMKNHKYEKILKEIYKEKYNPNQIEIDSLVNIELQDIFECLNVERYCCRRILITNSTFDGLLYASNINN